MEGIFLALEAEVPKQEMVNFDQSQWKETGKRKKQKNKRKGQKQEKERQKRRRRNEETTKTRNKR